MLDKKVDRSYDVKHESLIQILQNQNFGVQLSPESTMHCSKLITKRSQRQDLTVQQSPIDLTILRLTV